MSQTFHHSRHKKHHTKRSKINKLFDTSMYVIPLLSPVMTVPQLMEVWQHHQKASISLTTWIAFTFLSVFWLFYGVIHKEKQIILVNFFNIFLDGAIVLGVLFFR